MPGHAKSSLVGSHVVLPVKDGQIQWGSSNSVYLCEHRDSGGWGKGHQRKVIVTIVGV